MAKVFILTEEPFHDNSTVLSVHQTLAGALEAGVAVATHWARADYYAAWGAVVEGRESPAGDMTHLIVEHELRP